MNAHFDIKQSSLHIHRRSHGTANNPALFKKPPPMEGESWIGYLVRFTKSNHFPRVESTASLYGYSGVSQLFCSDPRDFLLKIGITIPAGRELAPHCLPRAIHQCKNRKERPSPQWKSRLCPICIRTDGDTPYLRSEWAWGVHFHCVTHEVMLLEDCQVCGESIDIRWNKIAICKCGADLRQQVTSCSKEKVAALEKLLPELDLGRRGKTFECEPDISRHAARVCKWLVQVKNKDGRRREMEPCRHVRISSTDLIQVSNLVSCWPLSFVNSVASEVNISCGASRTALGVRLMRTRFSLFGLVVKTLRNKVESVSSSIERVPQNLSVPLHRRIHIKQLSELTGHAGISLSRHIGRGTLLPELFSNSAQQAHDIGRACEDTFQSIKKIYLNTLSIDDAAKEAGCTTAAMRGLVRMDCLPTISWCLDRSRLVFRRVPPKALIDFSNEMRDLAKMRDMSSTELICFSSWIPNYGVGKGRSYLHWNIILKAIRSEKLTIYKTAESTTKLDELFLSREDLMDVCDKRRKIQQCFS